MKLWDMITMCLGNLFKRKVRTLLTVAGVVIGTCAIVVMVSFGLGIKQTQDQMMEGMGDLTVIQVNNYNASSNGEPLDDTMMEKFKEMEHVVAVTPVYPMWGGELQIVSGKYAYNGTIYGVYMDALDDFGYPIEEGQLPGDDSAENMILFGKEALYNFYNTKKKSNNMIYNMPDAQGNIPDPYVNPMEDKLELQVTKTDSNNNKKVKPVKLNCIGIMGEDWSKNPSPSYSAFMDVKFLKQMKQEYNKLNNIKVDKTKKESYESASVKVDAVDNVKEVQDAIKEYGFDTYSMESIREPLEQQSRTIQMILGGLGAISLLVAALGITNTMIMSIYERTREIGVMKVLGCVVGNIRAVFLMEAGTIGFIGGVVGILLSYGISFFINTLAAGGDNGGMGMSMIIGMGGGGSISIIPPWLALGALVFATMIGLVSGFYPANRAVKISALTAIRQE